MAHRAYNYTCEGIILADTLRRLETKFEGVERGVEEAVPYVKNLLMRQDII